MTDRETALVGQPDGIGLLRREHSVVARVEQVAPERLVELLLEDW